MILLQRKNYKSTSSAERKKLVTIAGSKKAVAMAVKNDKAVLRFTGLEEVLRK